MRDGENPVEQLTVLGGLDGPERLAELDHPPCEQEEPGRRVVALGVCNGRDAPLVDNRLCIGDVWLRVGAGHRRIV